MTSRMVGSVLTLVALLFSVVDAAAQTYTQMQWGMNKGVTPYAFGANINGTWRDLGTVSSAGSWGLSAKSLFAFNPNSVLTSIENVLGSQQGLTTAETIYKSHVPPDWFVQDAFTSALTLSPGSNLTHASAIGSYVRNLTPWVDDPACPGHVPGIGCRAAVGFFSAGEAGVDGARTWGLNPALVDNTSNTQVTTDTIGRSLIGQEFNFSVYANKTTVMGLSFILQGPSIPFAADGVQISAATGVGNNAKWTNGFVVSSGSANVAAIYGSSSSSTSANDPSMPVYYGIQDSAAVGHYVIQKAIPFGTNSAFQFSDNIRANGIALSNVATGEAPAVFSAGSDANIGLWLAAKGAAVITSLSPVVVNSSITVGVEGATAGSVAFKNATSGTITLQPATGALGTVTATLPANTGTIAETNLAQTFSATQTFTAPIVLASYTIGALPTCNAGALGSVVTVSNGTAYATGTYGSAVSATGIVTRSVLCTNTAGATTYAWAYN